MVTENHLKYFQLMRAQPFLMSIMLFLSRGVCCKVKCGCWSTPPAKQPFAMLSSAPFPVAGWGPLQKGRPSWWWAGRSRGEPAMGKEHRGKVYTFIMQIREEILAKDMEKDRSGLLIKVVEYRGIFFIYLYWSLTFQLTFSTCCDKPKYGSSTRFPWCFLSDLQLLPLILTAVNKSTLSDSFT